MKIGIIGAGNMGGAIARGILKKQLVDTACVSVASPNRRGELDTLKAEFNGLTITTDNVVAATGTDYVIIAVKPWLLKTVIDEIRSAFDIEKQTLVSVVAGVSCADIAEMLGCTSAKVVRLIPNTAISVGESMTFVSANESAMQTVQPVVDMMNEMGKAMLIEERLMGAGTALASCGIAYALRYIRAASEGGCELGFYADVAKEIVAQTVVGAAALLNANGSNPEVEIDKVTTPGGLTIKGLNAMERNGFTSAVIEGLKASVK